MPKTGTPAGAAERITIQARTTARVREGLEEAARESGRSLSQEMEMRLEKSLLIEDTAKKTAEKTKEIIAEHDQIIYLMLGGVETFSLLQDIAFLISGVETDQDKRWFESAELRAQVYKTLEAALPELIRAKRTGGIPNAFMRAVDYSKYLPDRPKKPIPDISKIGRFLTDEELKREFFLNDDNADAPGSPERAKRTRAVRVPLKRD